MPLRAQSSYQTETLALVQSKCTGTFISIAVCHWQWRCVCAGLADEALTTLEAKSQEVVRLKEGMAGAHAEVERLGAQLTQTQLELSAMTRRCKELETVPL